MTRLYALRDGVYQELDAKDASIELNYQIEDLRTPSSRRGPFSLTFELPFTQTNNAFFGHVAEPSLKESLFDINRRVQSRLHDDNLLVMEGVIQVTSLDLTKQVYKCRFYSAVVDIFTFLRGKKWEDVWRDDAGNIFCPLDHVLSTASVLRCWDQEAPEGIDASVPLGTVDYPITDNGNNTRSNTYNFPVEFLRGMAEAGNWSASNLHPAVKCSYLIDQILQYAGYTRTDDFWSDTTLNNDDLYVIVGLQNQVVNFRTSYGFRVSGSVSFGASAGLQNQVITNLDDSTAPNYDPDNLIQSSTFFSPNLAGQYTLQVNIQTTTALSGIWNSTFSLLGYASYQFSAGQAAGPNGITFTITPVFDVDEVDGFYPFMIQTAATVDMDVTITYVNFFGYNIQQGGIVDMVDALGDEPIESWLKGWVETFNLVMQVNERTKEVTFTPFDDYLADAGDPLDWTDKVDMTGPMELLPAVDYQKARLNLLKAESEDHRNKYYRSAFGIDKGDFIYIARSDFAEGEHNIGDFFGLLRLSNVPYLRDINTGLPRDTPAGTMTDIIISELWSGYTRDSVEYESLPPMLCYRQGLQTPTINEPYDSAGINLDGEDVTDLMPLYTSSTETNIGSSTNISLEYAVSAPDLVDTSVIGEPQRGLLEQYWYNYIQRLYSIDTRVLKCRAHLTPLDIHNLDLARKVNIKNVHYRIIAINNYVVGGNGLSNLTLLKESDGALYDCELTAEIGRDGRISWFNPDGTPADPTALCCASYGWVWDDRKRTCNAYVRRTSERDFINRNGSAPAQNTQDKSIVNEANREVITKALAGTATRETFKMVLSTTDDSATNAKTLEQEEEVFNVADNRSVSIIVDWVAVKTSGSNLGETTSGEEAVLLTTIDTTTTKADGSIYSRGASGLSVNVVASDGLDGSKFSIRCTGSATESVDWFLDVTLMTYDAQGVNGRELEFYTFQDLDIYEFQDGDQYLFNA